jgi:hypothetical protein
MRTQAAALCGAVLALVLMTPLTARADLIHWTYNWSRSPGEVFADAPGTGKLTLTDEKPTAAAGSSDIVATNIRAYSTASQEKPDVFTHKKYTLTLFLLDDASGKSGTLTFSGEFNGTLTATSANIKTTFFGATTQILQLGDNLYIASLNTYVPPGPPGSTNSGSIGGHTEVMVRVVHLPEPTALTLLGLGAGLVVLARRRRTPPLA